MFRRTLLVFLGLVLLVMAVTLGYALLGLSGPESTLEAARAESAAGRHAQAIRLLDITDRSLGPHASPELRAELLDLRYRSYLAVGNYLPALRDVASLRVKRPDDPELARVECRWTIVAGDPPRALDLAESFLESTPDDGVMLELAGEACQAIYQRDLRELLTELGTQLDPANAEDAFAAVRSWLYRDRRDPVASLGIERFTAVLREVRPEMAATGQHRRRLQQIRDQIRRALDYFARALEVGEAPVGAYLGTAYALTQAGRADDLQWLAEIYLHRFDHVYAIRAAVDLAELHLARQRHQAVLEISRRFLPRGAWRERLDQGRLDGQVAGLLLAEARALAAIDRPEELAVLASEAAEIQADGRIDLQPDVLWLLAIADRRQGRIGQAMGRLTDYDRALARLPQSPEVVERRIQVMNERLEAAKKLDRGPAFFEYAYQTLARLDARDPRAVLEQTRFRIDQQDPEGALLALRSARRVAAHDEDVLHIQAEAIDAQLARADRGSDSQLARCLELGIDTPFDAPDALLMLIAEKALEAGHPEIALASARRAAGRFNWARWPRHLVIRAAFALEDPETARRSAETLLAYHPGDVDALLDLREARRQLGLPTDDLVYDLLMARREDAATARALLDKALARGDLELARHLSTTIERRYHDDPGALIAVAGVQEVTGDLGAARETLRVAGELAINDGTATFREAFERYVVLTAATVEDQAEVQAVVGRFLTLTHEDADSLTRLAAALHQHGQHRYAYLMLAPVLEDEEHADARTGSLYELGGRIALELGLRDAAERHFLAAMTFPDGQGASRMLALLQLDDDRITDAAESFWDTQAHDLSTAALAARLDRPALAVAWVRRRLAESPADAGALALAAVVAPKDTIPAPFRELATGHGEALLDLLAFVDVKSFAHTATRRATELVQASSANAVARILLARAQARSGDVDEALRELDAVIAEEPLLIPAYEEATQAFERGDVDVLTVNGVLERLIGPELLRSGLATPSMVAFATRRRAGELVTRISQQAGAIEELAALWLRAPAGTKSSLDQVDFLAAVGRLDLALQLCEAVEPYVEAELRDRHRSSYFLLVTALLAQSPDQALAERASARALEEIDRHGHDGVVVHFLYDQDIATNGPLGDRRDPERVRQLGALLDAHLEFIRRNGDRHAPMLARTLTRLAELRGRRAAIDAATERLRADPSRIAIWVLRARWLAQEGEPEEAVDSLRWIHRYAPTHPIIFQCVELSARQGVIHPDDLLVVRESIVDESILETPDALLTRGLVALRRAEYQTAFDMISRGAARPDGAHLFYRGLALMPLGRVDEARELLEQCAADYPQSALTSIAGHFARQLSH